MPAGNPSSKAKGRHGVRTRRLPRVGRDAVLFVVGLLGILHETVIVHGERPTLLLLFGAMVGLPAFIRLDEKRNGSDDR